MTLPQQDAVDAMRRGIDPRVFDPSREPFAAPPGVDPSTGEIDRRERQDVARRPWPPRSGGPLPPADRLPPDLNIFTAQDEIDAWSWEHDAATTALESIRRRRTDLQIEVMKAKMKYRRVARANPTERGRRTADDISAEVDEALANDPQYVEMEHVETELEIQIGRLFRAKDNIGRLDSYIRSLPRLSDHRP
jgi:hypothetical protein